MSSFRKNHFAPIVIAISVVVGIIIGAFVANLFYGNRLNVINASSTKINDLLHIIDEQYVDSVDMGTLLDDAIPSILSELDPHSSYITAKDAATVNDDLHGSFSGVGIQFSIKHDTIYVSNTIKGGPSEKVGILAGDRIIGIDGKPFVGSEVTNEETMHRLKGEKGSRVKLTILRRGQKKQFTVTRDDIPVHSIEAIYMLDKELGYISVKRFGETTYPELLAALAELENKGFKGLVIDLRGNTGGYLNSAIQFANEFLPNKRLIVYTQGRRVSREDYFSDGTGSYQGMPLIILTDEITASSSEIVSGAIQDNDRGIIVGRRTFGKGLVQQPIEFSDGSLIHLTVARYYTPSGRCIQKPYVKGHNAEYQQDIIDRYNRGEFFSADSIQQTGERYHTSIGRVVYGGGGIMPDYFVSEDTTAVTSYYTEAITRGLITEFCFDYTDEHRSELASLTTSDAIVRHLRSQQVVEQFVRYADTQGLQRRNNQIIQSRRLFERALYGNIIYHVLDVQKYIEYLNADDPTIKKAIELYRQKKTKPTK